MYGIQSKEKYDSKEAWSRKRSDKFEFIGVDGEGVTRKGVHKYVLFGVGEVQIEDSEGLGWKDCFEFLYSQYRRRPQAAFSGFYLSYDFTQILKTLPEERARRLLTKEGIASRKRSRSGGNPKPFPVRYRGWEFDYLAGRRLQIRPMCCDSYESALDCGHVREPWLYICDSGPFWQTSFLNVINPANWRVPICTQEEFERVKIGKDNRSGAKLDDDMRFYNRTENVLHARAMTSLRTGFLEIGVNLNKAQWFGPGQAAAAWMKKEKVPSRVELKEAVADSFSEAARKSYFGGWFEIPCHGILPGSTWEYDINSAYPHVISTLPCLLHGTYSSGDNWGNRRRDPKEICFVRCRVRGDNHYFGSGFNRSKDGHIRRPKESIGWYLLDEVEAGVRAGLVSDFQIFEWAAYSPCSCLPPVRNVAWLYHKRLAVGKDSLLGKSAKLVYNSMYGKFAQSVGSAPFGNWAYAALITAGCRIRILDAMATHPNGPRSVVMVATDGIFFDSPHPGLHVSNMLGDWECKERVNLTLFKPGVYWDDKAREAILNGKFTGFKARGVNARYFASCVGEADRLFYNASGGPTKIPEFRYKIWEESPYPLYVGNIWPKVEFEIGFSMTSVLTALNVGRWGDAGAVAESVSVEHSSNPYTKRGKSYWDENGRRIRTKVLDLGQDIESVPYEKRFGAEDPFSLENDELFGIHPEGSIRFIGNTIRRNLTGEE